MVKKVKYCSLLAFNNKFHLLKNYLQGIFDRYPQSNCTLVISFSLRDKEIVHDSRINKILTYFNPSNYRVVRTIRRIRFIMQLRNERYAVLVMPEKSIRFQLLSFFIPADERYAYDVDHREWYSFSIKGLLKVVFKRLLGLFIIGPLSYFYILIIISSWGVARFISYSVKKALKIHDV